VPVSPIGSKYAPPGYLASRVTPDYNHNDDGTILGLVGIPKIGTNSNRYPYPFINSGKGGTRTIRNQYSLGAKSWRPGSRHGYSYGEMFARNDFLFYSLTSVFGANSVF
jgi:hypothetical protein